MTTREVQETSDRERGLRETIGKSPYVTLLLREFEARIGKRKPGLLQSSYSPEDNLRQMKEITPLTAAYAQATARALDVLRVPEDFAWKREAQMTLLRVIDVVRRLRLVDRDVLSDALRFAHPSNLSVAENGNELLFGDYLGYLGKGGKEIKLLPPPESRSVRDRYIKLIVGKEEVKILAGDLLDCAGTAGVEMSPHRALAIAMEKSIAHEFGHAIHLALQYRGRATRKAAEVLGIPVLPDLGTMGSVDAHNEHFARGIEEIVIKVAADAAGESEKVVLQNWLKRNEEDGEAARALLTLAKSRGYGAHGLYDLAENVNGRLWMLRPDDMQMAGDLSFNTLLARDARPYTQEQIKLLIDSPSPASE